MRAFRSIPTLKKMKIVQVPVLSDNYSYLVIDEKNRVGFAVDPAGSSEMLQAIERENIKLDSIFTTHHHIDHAGGNEKLGQELKNLKIYGGDERVQAINHKLKEGDVIQVGELTVKAHFTPCHTSGHLLYEVSDKTSEIPSLFTGDTLFIAGCGRFFEGTAKEMYHALIEVVASLPLTTHIFCGHEYTVKNLQFALTVEPNNKAVKDKLEWATKQRAQNLSTVPSTIGEELAYNPFMRVKEPSIAESLGLQGASPIDIMAELRKRKDKF